MYINPHNKFNHEPSPEIARLIALLIEYGAEITVQTGDVIIKEGQLCDFFFIVLSGSFRAYRLTNDKEMIIGFSFAGDIDTAPYAFINNTHSTETIETIVSGKIVKVYKSTLDSLKQKYPEFLQFTEFLLSRYIELLVQRHIEFKTFTAEQLYHTLYNRQPKEVQCIPLKFIASYLGISQERLSRIRSKKYDLT